LVRRERALPRSKGGPGKILRALSLTTTVSFFSRLTILRLCRILWALFSYDDRLILFAAIIFLSSFVFARSLPLTKNEKCRLVETGAAGLLVLN
jgi:hypothetical protein